MNGFLRGCIMVINKTSYDQQPKIRKAALIDDLAGKNSCCETILLMYGSI
jgi:hypothetical protein